MGWKLFGHGTSPAQLPAELRSILAQMQRERVAFETLTTGARESAQQLSQLSQPIAEAQKVVTELQGRVKALERLVPVLATLDEQTEAVSRTQRRTETQVDHTAEELKHLRGDIEQLRASFDAALALKGDLTSLLDSAGGLKSLRADADTLVGQVRDLSNTFERARQRQDELNGSGQAAAARLQAFEQRQQQVQGGIAAAQTRVTALEQALAPLGQAAANAAEENAKTLGALESRVAELRAVHDDLLARTREVSTRHDQVAQADQELRGRLDGLRDEVSRAVKRLELENQGLDAAGQRILDLRGGLTDIEARCRSLEEATRAIGDVQSQANGLVTQLGGLTETVAHLETHAEQLGRVQAEAERLTHTVAEMTQRVARLERAQPAVDAALRDFSSLKGTHEEVKEALERMRVAEGEIARAREGQAGTKAWLGEVSSAVESLRAELAAVEEIRPTVESVRSDADRLSQAMAQIESRRQLVDQVSARLSELSTLTEQVDERSGGLVTRLDATDEQFQALVAHAAEAARIEKLVPAVVGNVERAERRMTQVDAAVTALETRAQSLEGFAEQTRALGHELQRHQATLDSATEHLERASQLRAEAATIAQQLEERADQLSGALTGANDRTVALTKTLDDLESRAGNLRFVQKRMAQFEERLAKWHATEEQLMRALEQAAQRQATVDALRADLYHLFEVAQHTVDNVRAIGGAKEQVTETRALEERLARVEALLAGTGVERPQGGGATPRVVKSA